MTKVQIHITIDADLYLFLKHRMIYERLNISQTVNQYLRSVLWQCDEPISEDLLKIESELKELEPELEKQLAKRNAMTQKLDKLKRENKIRLKKAEEKRVKMLAAQAQRIRKIKPLAQEALRRRRL